MIQKALLHNLYMCAYRKRYGGFEVTRRSTKVFVNKCRVGDLLDCSSVDDGIGNITVTHRGSFVFKLYRPGFTARLIRVGR